MSAEPTSRIEAFSDGVFAIAITLWLLWVRLCYHTRYEARRRDARQPA
jgi:uncharacterized membrane protein